jgi:cysteinyl-tRNA synthetase
MVAMIEDLIAKGHAYAAEGHVLFAVESYEELRQALGPLGR